MKEVQGQAENGTDKSALVVVACLSATNEQLSRSSKYEKRFRCTGTIAVSCKSFLTAYLVGKQQKKHR